MVILKAKFSSKYIKLTRLKWAGHVIRKESQEISKKTLLAQPLYSRKDRTEHSISKDYF